MFSKEYLFILHCFLTVKIIKLNSALKFKQDFRGRDSQNKRTSTAQMFVAFAHPFRIKTPGFDHWVSLANPAGIIGAKPPH